MSDKTVLGFNDCEHEWHLIPHYKYFVENGSEKTFFEYICRKCSATQKQFIREEKNA